MSVLAADHVVVAVVILALLRLFGDRIAGREGHRRSVRRPVKAADARLGIGQLDRFAAVRADDEDLRLVVGPARGEGDPPAVGRPGGIGRGLLAPRQLDRFPGGRTGQPDLGDVGVLFEIGFGDRIGHASSVRRDARASGGLQGHEVLDARDALDDLRGGASRGAGPARAAGHHAGLRDEREGDDDG